MPRGGASLDSLIDNVLSIVGRVIGASTTLFLLTLTQFHRRVKGVGTDVPLCNPLSSGPTSGPTRSRARCCCSPAPIARRDQPLPQIMISSYAVKKNPRSATESVVNRGSRWPPIEILATILQLVRLVSIESSIRKYHNRNAFTMFP